MVVSLLSLSGTLALVCLCTTEFANGFARVRVPNSGPFVNRVTFTFGNSRHSRKYRYSNKICKIAELDDDSSQVYSDIGTAYFQETISDGQNDKDNSIFTPSAAASISIPNDSLSQDEISKLATSSPLISKSFLVLNAVAIIWGTQHVVIKTSLENFPSPSVLNFWRFSLSFLLFLPAFVSVLVSFVCYIA